MNKGFKNCKEKSPEFSSIKADQCSNTEKKKSSKSETKKILENLTSLLNSLLEISYQR